MFFDKRMIKKNNQSLGVYYYELAWRYMNKQMKLQVGFPWHGNALSYLVWLSPYG